MTFVRSVMPNSALISKNTEENPITKHERNTILVAKKPFRNQQILALTESVLIYPRQKLLPASFLSFILLILSYTIMDKAQKSVAADHNENRTRCEVWTRVMGYHRPVSHFNTGKKAEHYSREHFQECVTANSTFCEKF